MSGGPGGGSGFAQPLHRGTQTGVFEHHQFVGFHQLGPIVHLSEGLQPRAGGTQRPLRHGRALVAVRRVHPAQRDPPQTQEEEPAVGSCEKGQKVPHGPGISCASRRGNGRCSSARWRCLSPRREAGRPPRAQGVWSCAGCACPTRAVGPRLRRGRCLF